MMIFWCLLCVVNVNKTPSYNSLFEFYQSMPPSDEVRDLDFDHSPEEEGEIQAIYLEQINQMNSL